MMDDLIINSITSHLDILKSIFYWVLLFSLLAGWGVYRDKQTIDIAGVSLETRTAYNYILGFYVVINFIVLLLFFRINELLVNCYNQNINQDKLIIAIKSYPWVLNPFSNFSNNLSLGNEFFPSWAWFEVLINYISNGFGCFSLLIIWWVAHIALAFTQNGWNKSSLVVTAEFLLVLFFILWIILIFLIISNMGYEILPYGFGTILGFLSGFLIFGISLEKYKRRNDGVSQLEMTEREKIR